MTTENHTAPKEGESAWKENTDLNRPVTVQEMRSLVELFKRYREPNADEERRESPSRKAGYEQGYAQGYLNGFTDPHTGLILISGWLWRHFQSTLFACQFSEDEYERAIGLLEGMMDGYETGQAEGRRYAKALSEEGGIG